MSVLDALDRKVLGRNPGRHRATRTNAPAAPRRSQSSAARPIRHRYVSLDELLDAADATGRIG